MEQRILIAGGLIAAILPLFVQDEYILHICIMTLLYAVLASSLNLTLGYVGELSLGHTAYFGIGAYAAALAGKTLGWPIALTLVAGCAAAVIAGLAIGSITLRLKGPYFVIVTLAFAEVLRIVANNWVGFTNGPMGLPGVPGVHLEGLAPWLEGKRGAYYVGLALAALSVFLAWRFVNSNMGRACIAIRENRNVAQSVGIEPFRYSLIAFAIGAGMAGVSGAFYAHYITFVGPDVFGFSFMAAMLIMVLVGGKGTIVGPVLGALLVTFAQEYLRDLKEIRLSLFGVMVVLLVLFLPQGLASLLPRLRALGGATKTAPKLREGTHA